MNVARRNLVRVIARLNVGGPARHVMILARDLDGFDTTLVTGSVGAGEIELAGASDERFVLHRVPTLGRPVRAWDDLRALRELIAVMLRVRPVIVHTHTAKAGTLGRIAAVLTRVPIRVHTYHGHVFHGYFGAAQTRAIIWIERILARFTTRVVVISEQQKADIADRYHICRREKISVVPLGLEFDHVIARNWAETRAGFRAAAGVGDEVVIACVGRMVAVKNQQLLVRAFAALKDRNAVLVFVGGGEKEGALRALADEIGMTACVRFLGWRSDLAGVYAGSDIVALTSDNEGTPVCLIEALVAGCPVIATDVGGVRDVLENGRLGTLVRPGDVDAFAASLQALMEDLPAARAAARQNVLEVHERYNAQRLRMDMLALYDSLIASSRVAEPADPRLSVTLAGSA